MKSNKHQINLFLAGILIALGSFLFHSCGKEKEENAIPAADLKIYRQVQQFRQRLQASLKNDPPMTIDSAQWYIETTLNLTYGSASYAFSEMDLDTFNIEVPVSEGQVAFSDLQIAYESLLDSVRQQYHSLPTQEKQFIYCQLQPLETQLKSGTQTFQMVSGTGERYPSLFEFGPNDYWLWGMGWLNMGGYCGGPYIGTHTDSDAAMEIAKKIRIRKPVPIGNYSYVEPFVNVEIYPEWYPNPNDPTLDNIRDFLLFRSVRYLPNYTQCINPDDMNFYLVSAETIIYYLAKPTGLNFIDIFLMGDYSLGTPDFGYISHHGMVYYGKLIVNPDPPQEL